LKRELERLTIPVGAKAEQHGPRIGCGCAAGWKIASTAYIERYREDVMIEKMVLRPMVP